MRAYPFTKGWQVCDLPFSEVRGVWCPPAPWPFSEGWACHNSLWCCDCCRTRARHKFMDVSCETPDVTTKPTCYDLTNMIVSRLTFLKAERIPVRDHTHRYYVWALLSFQQPTFQTAQRWVIVRLHDLHFTFNWMFIMKYVVWSM